MSSVSVPVEAPCSRTARRKRRSSSSTGRIESTTYPGNLRLIESCRARAIESARTLSCGDRAVAGSSRAGEQPVATMTPRTTSLSNLIPRVDSPAGPPLGTAGSCRPHVRGTSDGRAALRSDLAGESGEPPRGDGRGSRRCPVERSNVCGNCTLCRERREQRCSGYRPTCEVVAGEVERVLDRASASRLEDRAAGLGEVNVPDEQIGRCCVRSCDGSSANERLCIANRNAAPREAHDYTIHVVSPCPAAKHHAVPAARADTRNVTTPDECEVRDER